MNRRAERIGWNVFLAFQLVVLIVAVYVFLLYSPEINWSKWMARQDIVYARDAVNCDSAKRVDDDACNLRIQDAANLGEPGTVLATNTLADDKCDSEVVIANGKCNATATAIPWETNLVRAVCSFLIIGTGLLFVCAWYLR